jgi:aspartokinase
MTIPELQTAFTALEAQATANTDVEASAVIELERLGALIVANAGDVAIITAIGEGMQNKTGALKNSADTLAAAIVAGTPVA